MGPSEGARMTDPTSMGVSLDPRSETVLEGERYLYQLTKALHIRFEEVPTALIPFERCGRVNMSRVRRGGGRSRRGGQVPFTARTSISSGSRSEVRGSRLE
ncbi:unnamed protein product, partial [Prorocentrum cordatum]